MVKEAYFYGRSQKSRSQERPTSAGDEALPTNVQTPKETYYHGKRDLFLWQKRPTSAIPEGFDATPNLSRRSNAYAERGEKRPISIVKEAYYYGKRDLLVLYLRTLKPFTA